MWSIGKCTENCRPRSKAKGENTSAKTKSGIVGRRCI